MDLEQKGYSMAEYIWIDGQNGVRSKTKVRILLVYPHVQPQCRLPPIFDAGGEAPEALLSAQRVTPLGLASSWISALKGSPNSRKCLVLLLIPSLPTDS